MLSSCKHSAQLLFGVKQLHLPPQTFLQVLDWEQESTIDRPLGDGLQLGGKSFWTLSKRQVWNRQLNHQFWQSTRAIQGYVLTRQSPTLVKLVKFVVGGHTERQCRKDPKCLGCHRVCSPGWGMTLATFWICIPTVVIRQSSQWALCIGWQDQLQWRMQWYHIPESQLLGLHIIEWMFVELLTRRIAIACGVGMRRRKGNSGEEGGSRAPNEKQRTCLA